MKLILKILFAPIIAVLAVFIWLCSLAIRISGMALSIVSGLFAVAGIVYMITESVGKGCIGLVTAFLLCPYGLPMLATWLLALCHGFRFWLKDVIYG